MGKNVLIVDGNTNLRKFLATGLRIEGYDVCDVADGVSACNELSGKPFDFVIIDLLIPGMNGLRLAYRIQTDFPVAKILLTSSYHVTLDTLQKHGLNVLSFLPKPFTIQELLSSIRKDEPFLNATQRTPSKEMDITPE